MKILLLLLLLFSWIFMAAMAAENTTTAVHGSHENPTTAVKVGVIVDLDTPRGKMYLSCIEMALSDFYTSHAHYKTRLDLKTRNSDEDVVSAADAASELIKNVEVKAILGPTTSVQASFIVNLGDKSHVPIVSFSATSPFLNSLQSSYFFQFAQNDSTQVKAISAIVQNFGWRQVVPIYVDNIYGEGIIPFLVDALQKVDAHVPYRSPIPQLATDDQIEIELYKLMAMETRVFVVHMMPELSSRLFSKAKEIGMMSKGYVWITTTGVGDHLNSLNSVDLDSMQGVLTVQTNISLTLKLRDFRSRWKRKFQQDNPNIINVELDAFGLRAYDAACALAIAIENIDLSFNSTNLDAIEVSQYGLKLSDALSFTSFKGMAGDFSLVDRQLQLSTIRIANVNGFPARVIGHWIGDSGRIVSSTNNSSQVSDAKGKLGPIIWPGESFSVPKGWEIPINGTKLKIGVPVKDGFFEYVNVANDPSTNTTEVTGFCIDVFEAVVKKLSYALPYELIPFAHPNGTSAGTYNDLIYQIYIGKYDAVVGDLTIRANRSLYVGFTMPYAESGIVMVVPVVDTQIKNAWVFLKPLTRELWITILCFFIFIGFVIWVLEHRINEDFRGPPSHQVGTSFWFSFSTIVFSQREKVVSNLARFVMIIWVFVVLIVTQSYTASLASLLTVQQLQPAVKDIDDLKRNGDNVGYMRNAFVYDLLRQEFSDAKLKAYGSMHEIDEALTKGSANGGISAIVHESLYMKHFVAKYCSKYTMTGPIYRTDGIGFAFPKHSPLLPDISQAILNLTEEETMKNIEDKWIKKDNNCKDSSSGNFSNTRLGLESFWVLFLIVGVASIFALVIFTTSFIYKHKHILMSPEDSRASKWKRIRKIYEVFNDRDNGSHTFKTSQHRGSSSTHDARDLELKSSSPNSSWPESPFSYTDYHTDRQASPETIEVVETNLDLAFTIHDIHETPDIVETT